MNFSASNRLFLTQIEKLEVKETTYTLRVIGIFTFRPNSTFKKVDTEIRN